LNLARASQTSDEELVFGGLVELSAFIVHCVDVSCIKGLELFKVKALTGL